MSSDLSNALLDEQKELLRAHPGQFRVFVLDGSIGNAPMRTSSDDIMRFFVKKHKGFV